MLFCTFSTRCHTANKSKIAYNWFKDVCFPFALFTSQSPREDPKNQSCNSFPFPSSSNCCNHSNVKPQRCFHFLHGRQITWEPFHIKSLKGQFVLMQGRGWLIGRYLHKNNLEYLESSLQQLTNDLWIGILDDLSCEWGTKGVETLTVIARASRRAALTTF